MTGLDDITDLRPTYRRATTARQDEVLGVMARLYRERGYPPTIRDLCAALGIASPNGIMCHLRTLAKKGLVRHGGAGASRAWIPVVPEGCCPCCGRLMETPTP